jgi:hypothetical protein
VIHLPAPARHIKNRPDNEANASMKGVKYESGRYFCAVNLYFGMDIILVLIGAWWLSGVLGCRKRKPKRRKKSSIWKSDLDVYDWEQHQKSNGR